MTMRRASLLIVGSVLAAATALATTPTRAQTYSLTTYGKLTTLTATGSIGGIKSLLHLLMMTVD